MTIFAKYHEVNGSLALRIPSDESLSSHEAAIQWEEEGPQGPPGEFSHIYYVYGPQVYIEPGEHATVEAVANDNGHDFVIGGGFNNEADVFVDTSQPNGRVPGNAWSVSAKNMATDRARFAQAFAVCVTIPDLSAMEVVQR